MARSILVPLDGSAFGEHALPIAARLARQTGRALHLAHVHQTGLPDSPSGLAVLDALEQHLRQDEQAYLADAAQRLLAHGPVSVTVALLDGDAADALSQYARQQGIDLVVMATHGRGALGRFWLGSFADEMVRTLPAPVLLVRPTNGKPDLGHEPGLKEVLVPLDGTEEAERVLEPALALGEPFGSAYTLVRVVRPVLRESYLPEGNSMIGLSHGQIEQLEGVQSRAVKEAGDYLEAVAARLAARGATVKARVPVREEPAVGILLEARGCDADLIAMATHGRGVLSRLFRGSVADKVVRASTVPVLLHRAGR